MKSKLRAALAAACGAFICMTIIGASPAAASSIVYTVNTVQQNAPDDFTANVVSPR